MKFIIVIFSTLFLFGCATTEDGMLPRSDVEAQVPWGYTDMCEDPERYSEVHCPEEEDD